MILQIDCVPNSSRWQSGFYRMMFKTSNAPLPKYWMFNGTWHFRQPPDLNPPPEWKF